MLLNMYIIRDYFPFPVKGHLICDRVCRRLERPAMAQGNQLEEGCVYVLEPETLEEIEAFPPHIGLILTAPPQEDTRLEQVDYLWPEKPVDASVLMNELLRVFLRFQRWELTLQKEMSGDDPLQGLTERGIEFLRNPIGVYTSSFYILSCAEKMAEGRDNFYLSDDRGRFIGEDEVNVLLTMKSFVHTWSTRGPDLFWGNQDGGAPNDCCLYQNLIIDGKTPARVVLNNYDTSFQDSDYGILDFFCGYIQQALIQSKSFRTNLHPPYFDQLLLELAADKPCNSEQLRRAMQQFGWKWNDSFFCGCIYSQQDDAVGSIANACTRLEDYIPGSCALQEGNHILLLIDLNKAGKTREQLLSKIVYHLREYLLKAGFSNEFTGITGLYESYRQARIALNFGMKKDSTFWVYRFEKYVLQYILEHSTQDLAPESLCHPGLLRLMESDKRKNRNYAGTLRVYLENNMNVAQTIRQIYIQRATFQYQLQRITEILDANLQDYETRLHLLLSFRLLDMKKRNDAGTGPV